MKWMAIFLLVVLVGCGGDSGSLDSAGTETVDDDSSIGQSEDDQNTLPSDTIKPTVTVSPSGGTFENSVLVTLTASEPSTIYYVKSVRFATPSDTKYTGPFFITESTWIDFMAIDDAGNESFNKSENYIINKPATKIAKVELKGNINIKKDSLGFIHFLGELINTGDLPVCFTKIAIVSKNSAGVIIDSDITYVSGTPMMLLKVISSDTCLMVGEFGAFEMFTLLKSVPDSFTRTIEWDSKNISPMTVPLSNIAIDGAITEGVSPFLGRMTLTGKIKNSHASKTVSFVKISAVALNGSSVIDTDFTYISGSACGGTILTTTCLVTGEIGKFDIQFSSPPSEVTSYYYKISYDVE